MQSWPRHLLAILPGHMAAEAHDFVIEGFIRPHLVNEAHDQRPVSIDREVGHDEISGPMRTDDPRESADAI